MSQDVDENGAPEPHMCRTRRHTSEQGVIIPEARSDRGNGSAKSAIGQIAVALAILVPLAGLAVFSFWTRSEAMAHVAAQEKTEEITAGRITVIDDRTDAIYQVLIEKVRPDVAKANVDRKRRARGDPK